MGEALGGVTSAVSDVGASVGASVAATTEAAAQVGAASWGQGCKGRAAWKHCGACKALGMSFNIPSWCSK